MKKRVLILCKGNSRSSQADVVEGWKRSRDLKRVRLELLRDFFGFGFWLWLSLGVSLWFAQNGRLKALLQGGRC
jgi:hypothetical protein